jgi:hypothetical protein
MGYGGDNVGRGREGGGEAPVVIFPFSGQRGREGGRRLHHIISSLIRSPTILVGVSVEG